MRLAALVDTSALLRVVLYSLVAGVGLTAVFSFAIVGLARFDDVRQGTRRGSAVAYAVLALVSVLIVLGAVVEAIVIMTKK